MGNKLDDMLNAMKLGDLIHRKKAADKKNAMVCILAVIGAISLIASIAYAVYRFMGRDYLEDFDDDFEDDYYDDYDDDDLDMAEDIKEDTPVDPTTSSEL